MNIYPKAWLFLIKAQGQSAMKFLFAVFIFISFSASAKKTAKQCRDVFSKQEKSMPYEELKDLMIENNIITANQYYEFREAQPELKIPSNPAKVYGAQWKGFRHLLRAEGLPLRRKNWMPYEELKALIRQHKISTKKEYYELREAHPELDIPNRLDKVYKEYENWKDFTQIGQGQSANWIPYKKLKTLVRENNISTRKEYHVFRKEHPELKIPSHPERVYKEYENWKDFTTIGRGKNINWIPYKKLKTLVRENNISTQEEYHEFRKAHPELKIPAEPAKVYGAQWKGLIQLYGTKRRPLRRKNWMPYEELTTLIRQHKISTEKEYQVFREEHPELKIPSRPDKVYKEYENWKDFTTIGRGQNINWIPYEKLITLVRENNIRTKEEYHDFRKAHPELKIPSHPERVYKEHKNWKDFTTIRKGQITNWIPYKKLETIVIENNISTQEEYHVVFRDAHPELKIPSRPDRAYGTQWKGFRQILRTKKLPSAKAIEQAQEIINTAPAETKLYKKSKPKPYTELYKDDESALGAEMYERDITPEDDLINYEDDSISYEENIMNYEDSNLVSPEGNIMNYEDSSVESPEESIMDYEDSNLVSPEESIMDYEDSNLVSPEESIMDHEEGRLMSYEENIMNYEDSNLVSPEESIMDHEESRLMSYEEAQHLMEEEGIMIESAFKQWILDGNRPPNFPKSPEQAYPEEWKSWPDFLIPDSLVEGIMNIIYQN